MNQVVIPKQVFIGDTAELRYSFHNTNSLLKEYAKKELKTYKEIPLSGFVDGIDTSSYSIKKVHLIQTGENNYTISVTFVPWKVGKIQLSSFDITGALLENTDLQNQVIVDFETVEILSIIEQKNLTAEINAPQNPKLLPGTIYGIYFNIIFILAFFVAILLLLIKHKSVNLWLKNQKLKLKYRKNKNETLKNISKILENYEKNDNEKEFCESIQKILRQYLENRFDCPFKNATASEIVSKYYQITLGILSEKKNSAVEDIGSVFVRTDFIRYSDSKNVQDNMKFSLSEAKEICNRLNKSIIIIETQEQNIENKENTGEEND